MAISQQSEKADDSTAFAPFILVRIYRPEGYEDVCNELVAEDALCGALGFEWELEKNSQNSDVPGV